VYTPTLPQFDFPTPSYSGELMAKTVPAAFKAMRRPNVSPLPPYKSLPICRHVIEERSKPNTCTKPSTAPLRV
jgi:hypothetical protein